ncbi:hypothetical protein ES703_98772 [subsurface metagenome]
MSEEKIIVPFGEAKKRLPEGNKVHTQRQSGFMIIGADWDKKELLKTMKKYEIRETGGMAKSMNHGLAIFDDSGWLFIATKKPTEVKEKTKEER